MDEISMIVKINPNVKKLLQEYLMFSKLDIKSPKF